MLVWAAVYILKSQKKDNVSNSIRKIPASLELRLTIDSHFGDRTKFVPNLDHQ